MPEPIQQFANNASGTLASGIGPGDLTIVLTAGHGSRFPALASPNYFWARLKKATGEMEIIKVTARATDTLTVLRSQDGTTPLAFSAGDEIRMTMPRKMLEDLREEATKAGRLSAGVDLVSGAVALAAGDKQRQKVITSGSTLTLPPAANVDVGDWIDFKSATERSVLIQPDGSDTIDGDNAAYRLPSFMQVRAMKSAAGAWVLINRPDTWVGKLVPSSTNTLQKGHVWGNGESLNATTYSGLFAEYVKTATVTVTIASPATVTWNGHPLRNNDPFKFTTNGALPTGLTPGTIYYVRNKTANTFELSATPGGAAINTSGTQSGTHTGIYAPHGCANDLSTFNTPDLCGRALIGRDDMGDIAAKGRITSDQAGFKGETLGAAGGDQRAQQHAHGVNDGGHVHREQVHDGTGPVGAIFGGGVGSSSAHLFGDGGAEIGPSPLNTQSSTTGISIQNAHSGNSQNVPPELVGVWMVKT